MANSNYQEEFLAHLGVEKGLSKNTLSAYKRDISRFILENPDPREVTPVSLEDHVANLRKKGLQESSISRAVVAIRNYLDFASKEGEFFNPIKDFKPPRIPKRLPKALSIEEVTSLIDSSLIEGELITLRDRALLELLYATGGRVSEIVNLSMADVAKLDGGEITSIRLFGKGNKFRVVPVGKFAQTALDQYLIRLRPTLLKEKRNDAVFLNSRGGKLSRQSAWTIVQDSSKRAG